MIAVLRAGEDAASNPSRWIRATPCANPCDEWYGGNGTPKSPATDVPILATSNTIDFDARVKALREKLN